MYNLIGLKYYLSTEINIETVYYFQEIIQLIHQGPCVKLCVCYLQVFVTKIYQMVPFSTVALWPPGSNISIT